MKEEAMAEKSERGFASMDDEKQREIASKGGKAAHAKGTAHEFTPEEAREAGRKGGEVVSQDREHMAEIGRQGGEARNKDDDDRGGNSQRGGTRGQHAEAGRQSHKNDDQGGRRGGSQSSGSGQRGGSSEQHAQAGRQSHKND